MTGENNFRKWAPFLAIVGLGLVAFHNTFQIPFVLDDVRSIPENPRIRSLWPLSDVLLGTSRPLVQLSLALNYAIGGESVVGYHIFNLTIHLLTALTLFGLLRRLWPERAGLALAVALLWEVHPLVTQPVNYVIQRGELLMSLFLLLMLYGVARRWTALAVGACALGMLCKPIMAIAPLVALLMDVTFFGRSWRERRGLYLGLAATWLILPVVLANGPADWKGSAGIGQVAITPLEYARTQAKVVTHYLRLAVWPVGLCFDYRWPVVTDFRAVIPALSVVSVGLGWTIWALVRRPNLGFWGAWFFILLAPTSSFIPVQDVAVEHRMYLALVALVALAALGVDRGLRRAPHLAVLLTVIVAIGFTGLTIRRNLDYRTAESLWRDTVAQSPRNARALTNLGNAVGEDSTRLAESIKFYQEALRHDPAYSLAHYNWGLALASQGDYRGAVQQYEMALQLKPTDHTSRYNLGMAFARQELYAEASQQFAEILKHQPDNVEAQYNLAVALEKQGQIAASIAAYQTTLRLDPRYAKAHYFLALALARAGRAPEARQHFETAAKLSPAFAARRADFEAAF
ncbi:MAG: hypothetical protein PCFJNLEI_03937 [Verrucomicrobiae bacterium]|nr:hypothetical protein [Verrucomicrobiae bacterium]